MTRVLVMLACLPMLAQAQGHDEEETVGRWRWKMDDRPVKAVTIAGSSGAWGRGNYSQFLQFACDKVEIANLAKTGYGAWALKRRFRQKVLKNRRLKLRDQAYEVWMIYGGGMNSVGMPEQTNRYMAETFAAAHAAGIKVLGLSLTPWGSDADGRWKGFVGLGRQAKTRKIVDFIAGRLGRHAAFHKRGQSPPPGEADAWRPGERPDIAVDLYDSALRDRSAELRPEAPLRRRLKRDKKHWQGVFDSEEAALQAARELPRWYMRAELHAFDHIHPNTEGHRVIAHEVCPRLPASWGCSCDRLTGARWEKGTIVR